MLEVVLAFGLLIAVVGALGVVSPRTLAAGVRRLWASGFGMTAAVGVRVVLGVALIFAAPETRFPMTIRVLGIVALVAAFAIPILGRERLDRMVTWWMVQPASRQRGWCVITLAFGAFVAYAAL